MKICIDCTLLRNDRTTGVERYIIELINSINDIYNKEEKISFTLVFNKKFNIPSQWKETSKFEFLKFPSSNRLINDQLFMTLFSLYRTDIDLFHFPVFAQPLFLFKPYVLTNHDSTFYKFPQTISLGAKLYYKPFYKRSLKRASQIICVSNSSKRDLILYTNTNNCKIDTVYEALSTNFKNVETKTFNQVAGGFQIKKPYIITVGTLEPRKNLKTLIEAFELLSQRNRDLQLVIVGRKGWSSDSKILLGNQNIVFTGFIDDPTLKTLYSNAEVFVFPSLYEGFGFPLLEAMSCGIPVVASKTSSLEEIGEGCCQFVSNPLDPTEFAFAIEAVYSDKSLQNKLINNGRLALQRFSWHKTAQQTIKIFEKIIKDKNQK